MKNFINSPGAFYDKIPLALVCPYTHSGARLQRVPT